MDDPEHWEYRTPLNGYLSPAAVQRWIPVVDDLADIVPAVLTLGLLGVPLKDGEISPRPSRSKAAAVID